MSDVICILLATLLIVFSFVGVSAGEDDHVDSLYSNMDFQPKFCKLLDADQLAKLKSSPSVGAVYFFKEVKSLYC